MLETLDLDKKVEKDAYEKSFPELRDHLRDLQRAAFEAKIPVLILFEGWDAAGKGDTIQKLVERLDPRGVKVHPISAPLPEELLRPFLWRFWTKIPGRGEMAVFDRSWYGRVMVERVDRLIAPKEWQSAYNEIVQFERMLTDDGTVVVKFWLHISEKEQKKRFKEIEKSKYDSWKVTKEDWEHHKQYDDYLEAAEEMLERTSTAYAPWSIVEATDRRYRLIKVFKTIIDAVETALAAKALARERREVAREDLRPAQRGEGEPGVLHHFRRFFAFPFPFLWSNPSSTASTMALRVRTRAHSLSLASTMVQGA